MADDGIKPLSSLPSNKRNHFTVAQALLYLPSSGILDFDLYSMFLSDIPFYLKASDLVICCSSPNLVETLIKEFAHVEDMAPYFNPFQHSLYPKSVYSAFFQFLFCVLSYFMQEALRTWSTKSRPCNKRTHSLEELCHCYLFLQAPLKPHHQHLLAADPQILFQGKPASGIRQKPWLQHWVTLQRVCYLLEAPRQVLRQ